MTSISLCVKRSMHAYAPRLPTTVSPVGFRASGVVAAGREPQSSARQTRPASAHGARRRARCRTLRHPPLLSGTRQPRRRGRWGARSRSAAAAVTCHVRAHSLTHRCAPESSVVLPAGSPGSARAAPAALRARSSGRTDCSQTRDAGGQRTRFGSSQPTPAAPGSRGAAADVATGAQEANPTHIASPDSRRLPERSHAPHGRARSHAVTAVAARGGAAPRVPAAVGGDAAGGAEREHSRNVGGDSCCCRCCYRCGVLRGRHCRRGPAGLVRTDTADFAQAR
eukprot:364833-Chlamydomonas_euryale.AAC.13